MSTPWPCLELEAPRARGAAAPAAACILQVTVVPNAPRTAVDSLHGGALKLRLAAPPVDGKANEALVAWLARELGLRRHQVQLLRGQSTRRKALRVEVTPEAAAAWLEGHLARERPAG